MIHLVDVDSSNWRTPLKVSKAQEEYVANSTTILARAYAYRNSGSHALFIQEDETPVGMVLYYDEDSLGAYVFSEIFIDEKFQGKGYGKAAAKKLYEGFGFVETERDEDEIIMELKL